MSRPPTISDMGQADVQVTLGRAVLVCDGVVMIAREKASPSAWRAFLIASVLACILSWGLGVRAEDVVVPVPLEAQLLAKVAGYDRNLPNRAGPRVKVLLVVRAGNPQSNRTASEMQRELGSISEIAGLPHDEIMVSYSDAASLRAMCDRDSIAIVFLAPGLAEEVEGLRAALEGGDVLTVAAVPDYVPKGIVLGFDLVSGKPKLVVQLTQARKQHVDFSSSVLKLMRVYE